VDATPTKAHIRLEHAVHEQIMVSDFTEQQRRILDLILRLSLGCGKNYAYIPTQSTFEVVGVGRGHVKKHLDWLQEAVVIFREGNIYRINLDFTQWRVSRALAYSPKKMSSLVHININHQKPASHNNLTKPLFGEEIFESEAESVTKNGTNVTPSVTNVTENVTPLATNLATPKESILSSKGDILSKANISPSSVLVDKKKGSEAESVTDSVTPPPVSKKEKGKLPFYDESKAFLDLVADFEQVKLIDFAKLIGRVRTLFVSTESDAPTLLECYKALRVDSFWAGKPPPVLICKLPDYFPTFLKQKGEGKENGFGKVGRPARASERGAKPLPTKYESPGEYRERHRPAAG